MLQRVIQSAQCVIQKTLIWVIKAYQQTLSFVFGGQCRFYPSCSHYTEQAIQEYGSIKGVWLGLWRILRCHPFHPGGFDPIPEKEKFNR